MDIISLGLWGNEKSRNWSFRFFEGQILKGFRIRRGYVVDGITFITADKSSNQLTSENTVGGEGGSSEEVEFDIVAGEYVTQISGTVANYSCCDNIRCITSMTIYTNLNKNGYGPYGLGRKEGECGAQNLSKFSSPTFFSDAIVGFYGGANQYLESIGLFVNPAPAKLGPWGNEQSHCWDLIYENQTIKRISIRHGDVVDAITFKVGDKNPVTWGNSFRLGGEGGSLDDIDLGPGEFLTQISGTVANYSHPHANGVRCITSITVHTNQNPNGYGPYGLGNKEGKHGAINLSSFSSPLISNNAIVGFCGSAKNYLESIGIFVSPIGRPTPRV